MPEGLSPGEVGKEISEHRAHALEEKESSGAEPKARDRVLTIIEAVLLAVVAVPRGLVRIRRGEMGHGVIA